MITKKLFDKYNGQDVYVYTITDDIEVTVCTLGATVLAIKAPDRNGVMTDVVLGMTNAHDMIDKGDYMGAFVGRCANRIANGRFTLNGKAYSLAQNNGKAHLHGGNVGFNQKVFGVAAVDNSLVLSTVSPDDEEGYPGELMFSVAYTVKGSELKIQYFASSIDDTLFNPTNHTYFNLDGESCGSIADNYLQIYADEYLRIDKDLIPTVKSSVKGTPFDFTEAKPIGRDIDADNTQLKIAGGYDHNFCLNGKHAARAYSLKTGIVLDVYTDMPGVQFYSGNFLSGNVGKSAYPRRSGFCLETQFYPNAINRNDCLKPILKRRQIFQSCTQYVFTTR